MVLLNNYDIKALEFSLDFSVTIVDISTKMIDIFVLNFDTGNRQIFCFRKK